MNGSVVHTVSFLGGTDIAVAAVDLCAMSARMGVLVRAEFNGILLLAGPADDPCSLVEAFWAATAAHRTIATANHLLRDKLIAEATAVTERCMPLAAEAEGRA